MEQPIRLLSLGSPHPQCFKGNMIESCGVATFMIRSPNSRLVAIGESQLFETLVLGIELQVAWVGIAYGRLTQDVDELVIEGDSSTMVG